MLCDFEKDIDLLTTSKIKSHLNNKLNLISLKNKPKK